MNWNWRTKSILKSEDQQIVVSDERCTQRKKNRLRNVVKNSQARIEKVEDNFYGCPRVTERIERFVL